ncbi:MAG TPA: hypothetical protein VKB67_13845 [Rhizomicrobium sp.]|nr:hypothetical protein [Rhizomicrobium sp.]
MMHIRSELRIPLVIAAVVAMGLTGCATAAKPEAMAVSALPAEKPFPQFLSHAMCIRNVTGGEKTNPLWVSKVDNDGFRSALGTSLDNAGLSAPASSCSYPVDVNLLGLSQPAFGLSFTVTSHVNYKVYDSNAQPVVLETIDAPYTATVSDALIAIERMRLANEGAIRASIGQFFDKLRDAHPAQTASAAQ